MTESAKVPLQINLGGQDLINKFEVILGALTREKRELRLEINDVRARLAVRCEENLLLRRCLIAELPADVDLDAYLSVQAGGVDEEPPR